MTGIISTSHYIAGLPVSIKFTCNHLYLSLQCRHLVGVIKLALQSCDRHFIDHAPYPFSCLSLTPLVELSFLSPVFHCMKNSRWRRNFLRCERLLEEILHALQANLVINRVGNIADFGHKWGKGFGNRLHTPTQFFWDHPPGPILRSRVLIRNGTVHVCSWDPEECIEFSQRNPVGS